MEKQLKLERRAKGTATPTTSSPSDIALLQAQIGDVFRRTHIIRRETERLEQSALICDDYVGQDSERALLRDVALTLRLTAESIDMIIQRIDEPLATGGSPS